MAGIEFTEETKQRIERIGSADVVVGIAGPVSPGDLRKRAEQIMQELGPAVSSLRFVFAWPETTEPTLVAPEQENGKAPLALLPFPSPPQAAGEFWVGVSANQRAVLALAASLNARACIVLGSDLAGLRAHAIQIFSYALLDRQCGVVMPVYPLGKYEALVNSGILAPLHRTLYGKRLRYPLAFDFGVAGNLCERLAGSETGNEHAGNPLLWPVAIAAAHAPQIAIGQVHIDVHHQVSTGGLELSALLSQIVGSLFHEMEIFAPQWQRVRGSQSLPVWGNTPENGPDDAPIDVQHMLDSFLLGSRSLEEVWRLVLPPNTMLELRRLTRMGPGEFRMPDELWAGIVYDFALAYRLRTISRVHLLGALTPLYLGWVASYVREVSNLTWMAAEQRLEQFARAWEDKKPYLLSRWRWPDRFNP